MRCLRAVYVATVGQVATEAERQHYEPTPYAGSKKNTHKSRQKDGQEKGGGNSPRPHGLGSRHQLQGPRLSCGAEYVLATWIERLCELAAQVAEHASQPDGLLIQTLWAIHKGWIRLERPSVTWSV